MQGNKIIVCSSQQLKGHNKMYITYDLELGVVTFALKNLEELLVYHYMYEVHEPQKPMTYN